MEREVIGRSERKSLDFVAANLCAPLIERNDFPNDVRIYCAGFFKEGEYIAGIINRNLPNKKAIAIDREEPGDKVSGCYNVDLKWFIGNTKSS